jgi:hypothetical protein
MAHLTFSDQEQRLIEMGGSFIAVDHDLVNLDDLLRAVRPGAVVRCAANPNDCIKVVVMDEAPVGCVAGWISEGE